ncbi:MAG: phage tail tape measure protein [Lachnospiraceae bacterium]|nr:phage tail tape measure protein [Lachnospiraceae bacterium]
MATELAKAYVQIIPSAQGIQGALSSALDGEATAAGTSAGTKLGNALLGGAKVGVAAFGAMATGMGAFGASSVETGKEFDAAMSQVAATMGTTVDQIGDLRDFAMEMGSTTAFSATQAAEALNYMALAGYDAETSMAMLPNVLNLAAAGGIDLAAASDMVTDASSALGLSTEETAVMVDMMAQASSKSNTSIAQLGEAFLTVGGTAKDLNGGTLELSTALGILADNGIKGSEGGTALRNIILSLEAPTDNAAIAMEKLGLEVFDSEGNMRNLNDIFRDMNTSLSTMTQGERTQVLNQIFNKVDLKSVNALLANTDAGLSDIGSTLAECGVEWGKYNENILLSQGSAEALQEWSTEMLWTNLDTAESMAEMQEFLQYEYGLTAEDAEMAVKAVNASIEEQESRWDELTGYIDDAAGASQNMANTQLDNLAGDITLFESALEGAKIAVSDQLTPGLREFVQFGSEGISELTMAFQEGGLAGAMEALGGIITEGVGMILESLPEVVNAGAELLTSLVQGIAENAPLIAETMVEVASTITTTLLELLPTLLDAGLTILANIAMGIANAIPQLVSTIVDVIAKIVEVIIQNLPMLIEAALQIIIALTTGIFQALPTLLQRLPELIKSLVETLLSQIPVIIQAGVDLLIALVEDLPTIIKTIVEVLPEIVTSIVDTLIDNIPLLIDAGFQLFVALIENLPEIIVTLVAAVPELIGSLLDALGGAATQFVDMGFQLMMGLVDGIVNSVGTVIEKSVDALGGVVDSIKKYFGISSPSKMFEEFGGYLDMGLAIGIEDNTDLPIDAMADMSSELERAYDIDAEVKRQYTFEPALEGGDITIPVYIGDEEIETIVVNAQDRNQYRSGGR